MNAAPACNKVPPAESVEPNGSAGTSSRSQTRQQHCAPRGNGSTGPRGARRIRQRSGQPERGSAAGEVETALNEGRQRLHVLVLYEDLSAGLRVWQTLGGVVQQLAWLADFTVDLQGFDLLTASGGLARSADDPKEADIVFLATHGRSDLPPAVNRWLSHWLTPRNSRPRALVLSLDAGAEQTPEAIRLRNTFVDIARLADVDVFLHAGDEASTGHGPGKTALSDQGLAAAAGTIQFQQPFESHPLREWGINE